MSVDRVTTLSEVQATEQDLHRIFAVTPHPYLVLAPSLVIVGANDAYLRQTLTNRSDIVGCHMFEVFPDNPDVPESHGVRLLQASLEAVFDLRLPHRMAQQRYDVRGGMVASWSGTGSQSTTLFWMTTSGFHICCTTSKT